MSDRHTDVSPRNAPEQFRYATVGVGIADHGRKSRAEMIAQFRKHWESMLRQAEFACSLSDDELIVTTHTGSIVQRNKVEVTDV